jgi:phage-related protein
MDDEKQMRWVGSSYDDLLAFPKDARKEAGFQSSGVTQNRPVGVTSKPAS